MEKDRNSSMVTTWMVTPAGEGRPEVVVTTVWNGAGGIGGFFEKTFAPKGLGRIYDAVLAKLAHRGGEVSPSGQSVTGARAGAVSPVRIPCAPAHRFEWFSRGAVVRRPRDAPWESP